MRLRITVSAVLGLASGTFCWFLLQHFHKGAGDFNWAVLAAQDLLAHRNPYDRPMQLYPLTCAVFGLPFVWMPLSAAGGAFYGISTSLLAFGLTRSGYRRLYIFLAYPYWAGLLEAQWGPLILAGAFFAPLLPAALAKPQLGLPILLTTNTRRGVLACFVSAGLAFALMPGWVTEWVSHFPGYARFIPVLILPGPLLTLALFRFRQTDARTLLVAAVMPQRWFYDAFILWLIPKSRWEIVCTVLLSWAPGVWRWYQLPNNFTQVGRWIVIFFYLPMLAVILMRGSNSNTAASEKNQARSFSSGNLAS